jgi:hypothetical protein
MRHNYSGTVNRLLLAAGIVLIAAGAGCGSEEVPASHRDVAQEALLSPNDLSRNVKVEGGLPTEPCGPTGIFRDSRGRAAETEMFNFQGIRVQEAVGVFPSKALAEAALVTLIGKAHAQCVAQGLSSFGKAGDKVEMGHPQTLDVGDRSAMFRLWLVGPQAEERGAVAIPSIRTGRCVSALIIFARSSPQLQEGFRQAVPKAAQALTAAC